MSEVTQPAETFQPFFGTIEPGIYRHFKGPLYLVVGVNRDCNTQRMRVRYYPLYGAFVESSRDLEEFLEEIFVEPFPDGGSNKFEMRSTTPEKARLNANAFKQKRFVKVEVSREASKFLGITLQPHWP